MVLKTTSASTNGIDRISNLPNDVLHHIFSTLPFQSIAQTSVLSKRWRHVWVSNPTLEFCCPPAAAEFSAKEVEFMKRTLSRRHEKSLIKLFKVKGRVGSACLHDCISGLEKHRVEDLVLQVCLCDSFDLPQSVFEWDSLRSLTLNSELGSEPRRFQKDWFRFPSTYVRDASGLRSLHTLSLIRVELPEDLFSDSSFPCLENLTLARCRPMVPPDLRDPTSAYFCGVNSRPMIHLSISCQGLKDIKLSEMKVMSLHIYGLKLEKLQAYRIYNVFGYEFSVNIFAPNLQIFSWEMSGIYKECLVESFPALRRSLIVPRVYWPFSVQTIHSAVSLLSGSSQVQELVLLPDCFKILSEVALEDGLSFSFMKLETLTIETTMDRLELLGVTCLFESCPIVHTLTVSVVDVHDKIWSDTSHRSEEEYLKSQVQELSPFLCNLKVVKINVVTKNEAAMDLARFLLEYGRVLEKITLSDRLAHTRSASIWEEKIGFLEGLPRAATDVEISYV